MIDENKLIEELNKMGQEVERHLKSAEKEGNVMFAFAIENQLAMLRNVINRVSHQSKIKKWIPCNKRLPDKDGKYLVTYQDDLVENYVIVRNFYNGKFEPMPYSEKHTGRKALAWQPLPEPYQPKGEDRQNGKIN